MFSLKHVDDNKCETLVEAVDVKFDPKKNELVGYGSPSPQAKDGIIRFNTGAVFVVNDHGDTVGAYSLRMK